ncbi:triose-phosphate isomerase [Geothrix sp. 21YS21S-2]|uniref:triose-phosphate isomerase n=1 Tax=Geothrix sp. 21YS21S-2 TaxID=3068893 RepID=UPI0027BAC2C7|nr:triose-phosphate isomerase [Geothrix sp. 21YS21S-2]
MRMVVANWKMNHLRRDAEAFCAALLASYKPVDGVVAAIAPPFPLLPVVSRLVAGSAVRVYAQNAHAEAKGAYTGEVSMAMVMDAGCTGVLLGHSERRQYNGETEATLLPKLKAAAAQGLLPMLCVGETLAQRDADQTLDVLRGQLSILAQAPEGPLAVAYEPVWAIGTGRVATVEQIAEVHAFIRKELVTLMGGAGGDVPILYGGSVTPDNFPEILKVPHVAGGLVGGASLDPAKFLKLLEIAAL